MLTSIHIQGFKDFKDTKIEPLRKVNLILGGQNVGKTSLLEAVWLGAGNVPKIHDLSSIFRLEEDGDAKRYFESVFSRYNLFCITLEKDFQGCRTYLKNEFEFVGHNEVLNSSFGSDFMQS